MRGHQPEHVAARHVGREERAGRAPPRHAAAAGSGGQAAAPRSAEEPPAHARLPRRAEAAGGRHRGAEEPQAAACRHALVAPGADEQDAGAHAEAHGLAAARAAGLARDDGEHVAPGAQAVADRHDAGPPPSAGATELGRDPAAVQGHRQLAARARLPRTVRKA
jgi:hypothetical protein